MPIYEYQCQDCGEVAEVLQKISDPPLVECPACGAHALKKKVSAVAFRLKGGGWYETDFKTGEKRNLAGGEGGGEKQGATEKAGGEKASGEAAAGAGTGAAGDRKTAGSTTKPKDGKGAGDQSA